MSWKWIPDQRNELGDTVEYGTYNIDTQSSNRIRGEVVKVIEDWDDFDYWMLRVEVTEVVEGEKHTVGDVLYVPDEAASSVTQAQQTRPLDDNNTTFSDFTGESQ